MVDPPAGSSLCDPLRRRIDSGLCCRRGVRVRPGYPTAWQKELHHGLAQSITSFIPDAQRLDKNIVAAGHQTWERGDLLSLDFDPEVAEVGWICDRLEAMRGLAFLDNSGATARGLSWSDCAVLYRSVAGTRDRWWRSCDVAWATDAPDEVRCETWNTARKGGLTVERPRPVHAGYAPWKSPKT